MARMESPQRETARVTVRIPEEKKERFKTIVESEGLNMTESITQHIDAVLDEHDPDVEGDYLTPDDESLASAYEQLVDLAEEVIDGAGLRVTRQKAMNNLYSNEVPKDAVMDEYIIPLKREDFVRLDQGMNRLWIVVRPPEPVG